MTTQTARPSKILVQSLSVQVMACILFGTSAWLVAEFGRVSVGRVELAWLLELRYVAAVGVLASFATFGWMTMSLVRPDPSSDLRIQTVAMGFTVAAGILLLSVAWAGTDIILSGVPGTMPIAS